MSDNHNPPAFPKPNATHEGDFGMTLRDFFAAMQLAGASANPLYRGEVKLEMARAAYSHADNMLKARQL